MEVVSTGNPSSAGMKPSVKAFLLDVWKIVWCSPGWFLFQISALASLNALEPSLSWVAKTATSSLEKYSGDLSQLLLPNAWTYVWIAVGIGVLSILDSVSRGLYHAKVVFALQRMMLSRRESERTSEDVTRMVYDSMKAKQGLSPFFFDLWRNVPRIISVVCWQMSLAPAWIPALFIVMLPTLISILIFTPRIQTSNKEVLEGNSKVTSCSREGVTEALTASQESLWWKFLKLESWEGAMRSLMQLSKWPMLLLLVLVCKHWDLPLIPKKIELGDFAGFLVNMGLISLPISELGKMYVKMRGNWPAIRRVMYPQMER